jgi:hypothetical protein
MLETNSHLLRTRMTYEESVRLAEVLITNLHALFSPGDRLILWNHSMLRALIVFLSADSAMAIDISDVQTMLIQMIWSQLWIKAGTNTSSAPQISVLFMNFLLDVVPRTPEEGVPLKDTPTYKATCNAIMNVRNFHSSGPDYHWYMVTFWIYALESDERVSVLPFTLMRVHLRCNDSESGFWLRLRSLLERICSHVQTWNDHPKAFQALLLFLLDEVNQQPPPQLNPWISSLLATALTTLPKNIAASERNAKRAEEAFNHVVLVLLLIASLPPTLFRTILGALWEWHAKHRVGMTWPWTLLDALFCGDWAPLTDSLREVSSRNFRMSLHRLQKHHLLIDIPSCLPQIFQFAREPVTPRICRPVWAGQGSPEKGGSESGSCNEQNQRLLPQHYLSQSTQWLHSETRCRSNEYRYYSHGISGGTTNGMTLVPQTAFRRLLYLLHHSRK